MHNAIHNSVVYAVRTPNGDDDRELSETTSSRAKEA
jgi:hypothetical protein